MGAVQCSGNGITGVSEGVGIYGQIKLSDTYIMRNADLNVEWSPQRAPVMYRGWTLHLLKLKALLWAGCGSLESEVPAQASSSPLD
ncbi:hypothetical protein TNCV_3882441 [Trichonephila clavipes]|nr:hypothetical protein TNCV_3882441 [Trichonephila clavipes]